MARKGQVSLAQLSKALGFNPKTVATWRKRATVEDKKTGPTETRSTVLTEAEEAAIIAFRRHTLLPLDDCLYACSRPMRFDMICEANGFEHRLTKPNHP